MMVGSRISSLLRNRNVKKRTIVIGLKFSNSSRELLLRVLHFVVMPGDTVLAVHVQELHDSFDPNTFQIHEDLCKSKQGYVRVLADPPILSGSLLEALRHVDVMQRRITETALPVDFQVKICAGRSYITELSHQVRVNFATILAIGCSTTRPNDSIVSRFLKALPPTCSLLVMDDGGKIMLQRKGTSQQGGANTTTYKMFNSSVSAVSPSSGNSPSETRRQIRKSLTMPCCSTSSSFQQNVGRKFPNFKMNGANVDAMPRRVFQKLAALEIRGCSRRFTLEYVKRATDHFNIERLIAEDEHSKVYRAILDDGQVAAVKVYHMLTNPEEDFFKEVEILSGLKHENIVQLFGYCYSKEINAVFYNLLKGGSMKEKLAQLNWTERIKVAVGVAKSLVYLHSCSPPITHKDVHSSNILLSEDCQPHLSGFRAAVVHQKTEHDSALEVQNDHVVGSFGYLAPEYIMYGKVDEKIDVYSYGVVLLELITGKEATQSRPTPNHESLVLWARSMLSSGLCDRLIDPNLREGFNADEMKIMMIAARLCLLHSSSRRPSMKTILRLFEDPAHWLEMQNKREKMLGKIGSYKDEKGSSSCNESDSCDETVVIDD